VRREPAVGGHARTLEIVLEIELAGVEVTVLQAEIDILANGGADAGDQLPGPGAVLLLERLDAGEADAAAGIEAEAAVVAEVEQQVAHAGPDGDLVVEV
jgi:hypothetical protein